MTAASNNASSKNLITQALLFLCAITVTSFGCSDTSTQVTGEPNSEKAPGFAVVDTTYETGTVMVGDKVSHIFKISNDSREEWTVAKVRSNCGCIASELSADRIPAGSSATVKVTFTAGKTSYEFATATICQFAQQSAPIQRFIMKGVTRTPIAAAPDKLSVTGVVQGKPERLSLVLYNFQQDKCALSSVSTDAQWLAIQTSEGKSPSAKQVWNIGLVVNTESLPLGKSVATLQIRARNEHSGKDESLNVPITIMTKPILEPEPQRLFFGEISPGGASTSLTRVVNLKSAEPLAIDQLDVTSNLDEIVEFACARDGTEGINWTLSARFQPPAMRKYLEHSNATERIVDGKVNIGIRGSKFPQLEIPVTALLKRSL